jgi:hypothetical protein
MREAPNFVPFYRYFSPHLHTYLEFLTQFFVTNGENTDRIKKYRGNPSFAIFFFQQLANNQVKERYYHNSLSIIRGSTNGLHGRIAQAQTKGFLTSP